MLLFQLICGFLQVSPLVQSTSKMISKFNEIDESTILLSHNKVSPNLIESLFAFILSVKLSSCFPVLPHT